MTTTSDVALLRRKLAATDYNPDLYVKEISNRCVGGHELLQQRSIIKALSDDTHTLLKKNVYQNYGQFIETAKEISFLESEMYQLSHMITEQRHLLTNLAETSLLGDKVPLTHQVVQKKEEDAPVEVKPKATSSRSDFEEGRRRLYELLERVEGCSHVTDVPTRYLLHDGDLVEMDPAENTALHRVHGYLLNDGFMVATWLPNRRGPVRFKYSCLYDLDSLAVVNVRDLGGIKHAFKLLVFPDTRLFQCANAEAKQVWMEQFDKAKKGRQKQQENAVLKRQDTQREVRDPSKFAKGDSTESSTNPFDAEEDKPEALLEGGEEEAVLPEWIAELPDDLEVHIAQREFDMAVDLVLQGQEFCHEHSDSALVREAQSKIEGRTKHLIEVLKCELSAERSVQGGPRSARRAVQMLVRLGRSAQAVELFLNHRSAILQAALKGAKLDSATFVYVQRLTNAFVSNLLETSQEFRKAFVDLPQKLSSFLVWVDMELDVFAEKMDRQIFSPQTPLETISSCVAFIRDQCQKLQEHGLDVLFLLDTRFRRNVERTICEHRDKHIEAVKLRAQEDKWEAINCFNKSGTDRFLDEMSAAGIPSVRAFVYNECWVSLTRNTTSFALSYLNFAESLLKLFNPSLRSLVNESLVNVFHSHLRHIEQAVRSDRLKKVDPKFIQKNAAFLLDTLLSLIEHRYQNKTGSDCPKLGKLHASYSWLKEGPKATTAAYSDPNYI